jgi:exopolyphosphatase/guanosine-5'-triphosphate,3'-diphosphate pyrophosphatase
MPRYAAIDIGSNSVRMEAAEVIPGSSPIILAADREVTRLGSGVFSGGRISTEATDFVCQVLTRMAQTYQRLDVAGVRAVATSAVRDASNQDEFIRRVTAAIGVPVEIISGLEEARLIHLGVQSRWPHPDKRILIVDIGGGSAEIIAGENGEMQSGVSRPLGAVRLTETFMKSDPPGETDLHRLEQFIDEKLDMAVKKIGVRPFDRAIGTSSTAAAVVCAINRIPRVRREEASRLRATTPQVRKLYRALCESDLNARRKIGGIGPRRAEIIVPGAAVLLKVLEAFRLPAVYYSGAGVRDGIIADLAARGVGRELSHLSREQLQHVEGLARKYGVPAKHARRVAAFAHQLFESLQPLHKLPPESAKLLEAAAHLLDTGHFISSVAHHKHSAYVVQNSDMPGFTDRERLLVATLCRFHRKALPSVKYEVVQTLSPEDRRMVTFLTPLLRVADGLDSGQEQKIDRMECQIKSGGVVVTVEGENIDLELWAAERAAEAFRQVYERPLQFVIGRRVS